MVEPTVPAPDALTKEAPVQQELASSKVSSDATAASRTATNPGSVPVVTGLSVTNTNVASPGPQRSTGSGEGAVNIQISPAASKLLVSKDDIAIDREKRLGEGGFGVVYVGTLRGSTKVAVKTIKGDLDEKAMAAFVKEVANWEGLVQRNVLPLMAFCVSPPMMVMDLIEEGNLRKYLGARAWDQALGRRFLHDVACGMAYLHSAGILHGDLKSLNVLVDGSRAVITDFGLSRVRVEVSKSTQRTGNGLQGTPGFVAPEVLSGEPIRPPADVYAFAMTCYEVVSRGKYPFEDIHNIVYRVAIDKMRPERPQGVADDLWALIERAWQHDAAARPDFVQLENELARMSM
ncbi:kinase-like domain-containing protein [Hyaloraphidium curvatum]|nr:kinase-like domain-containing protein [Hyaloraphidium curvatum]